MKYKIEIEIIIKGVKNKKVGSNKKKVSILQIFIRS